MQVYARYPFLDCMYVPCEMWVCVCACGGSQGGERECTHVEEIKFSAMGKIVPCLSSMEFFNNKYDGKLMINYLFIDTKRTPLLPCPPPGPPPPRPPTPLSYLDECMYVRLGFMSALLRTL